MPIPTADELVAHYASHVKGKVIITTGVSPGSLGAYFVQAIAKASPAWIILAGRDLKKAQQTEATIIASTPSSVWDAAAAVNGWSDIPVIDVLLNNAGIMAKEYSVTVDGFERSLAANHLGHFLFTNLIINKILTSSSPQIINVSSDTHRMGPFRFGDFNFDGGKMYNSLGAYGQSKTANMLVAISLAKKLGKCGLLTFSLHPGIITTNSAANLDFKKIGDEFRELDQFYGNKEGFIANDGPKVLSLEQGSATHVYAAFNPDLSTHNRAYLVDCHVADPVTDPVKPWANSPFEAEKLWRLSKELMGQKFSY